MLLAIEATEIREIYIVHFFTYNWALASQSPIVDRTTQSLNV